MTNQEFFKELDKIVISKKPENGPDGKDADIADLLVKAYEEDLNIWVAGQTAGDYQGFISISIEGVPIRNAMSSICYSSPETAKLDSEDIPKFEISVRNYFRSLYNTYEMVGLLMNYGIDGKDVCIARDDITTHLTPTVRNELKAHQKKAKLLSRKPLRFPPL